MQANPVLISGFLDVQDHSEMAKIKVKKKNCGTKEIRYDVKEKTLHAAITRLSTEVEEMKILA